MKQWMQNEKTKRLFQILLMMVVLGLGVFSIKREQSEFGKGSIKGTTKNDSYQMELFAMDTYMTLSANGGNAEKGLSLCMDEINRLDVLLSAQNPDSEISECNRTGTGELSEDSYSLLERSVEIYELTEGAFDITIYPIVKSWGFPTHEYQIPSQETLDSLLKNVDSHLLSLEEESHRINMPDGVNIDVGGIAKGYLGYRLRELLLKEGVTSALLNLGGNIQLVGSKEDGSLWKVGIQKPDDQGNYLGVLSVEDVAVVTSGGYQRFFEQDGIRYHHILDPKTGYPANKGLTSVTIVSQDGTLADGLSTALFVMGTEEAISFWKQNAYLFDCILYTESGELYVTKNLAEYFETELPVIVLQ